VVRSVGLAPRHPHDRAPRVAAPRRHLQPLRPVGFRHQVFICDTADPDIAYLESPPARSCPGGGSHSRRQGTPGSETSVPAFENNACWVELVLMAQDLIAFTQGLVLDGDMAKVEPKRLRYALLHVAGRINNHRAKHHPAPPGRVAMGTTAGRRLQEAAHAGVRHLNQFRTIHGKHLRVLCAVLHAPERSTRVTFNPRKKPIAATGVSHSGHG